MEHPCPASLSGVVGVPGSCFYQATPLTWNSDLSSPASPSPISPRSEFLGGSDGKEHSLSVHGILQARILEWVAISSSRGSS